MIRSAMAQLYKWKTKKSRKPLILRGARQVGKTRLMNLPLWAAGVPEISMPDLQGDLHG